MNTETSNENENTENTAAPTIVEDIVKRDIMRELPCKLDDGQLLKIARDKAKAEADLEEIESDFKDAKDEWGARIGNVEKRIAEMGAELRTGEEKRVINCYERFVSGTIEVVRSDTKQVIERRAANLSEAQRAMPLKEDDRQAAEAAKAQRDAGVEESEDGDVVAPEGDGKRNGKSKRK